MTAPEFTAVYHADDKAEWGPGPWQDEPDKATWIDPATDLDCMIRRGGGGAWCGYVGVPPGHPWHHKSYDECVQPDLHVPGEDWHYDCTPEGLTEVHGGLTFSGECDDDADPATGVCHVPQPGRPADVTWFGFDCNHHMDSAPAYRKHYTPPAPGTYRDLDYVVAETRSLAAQLAEVAA